MGFKNHILHVICHKAKGTYIITGICFSKLGQEATPLLDLKIEQLDLQLTLFDGSDKILIPGQGVIWSRVIFFSSLPDTF